MTTFIAILLLVSLPFLLDLYLSAPDGSEREEEEYIPDGR
jgi:hypothetical protein